MKINAWKQKENGFTLLEVLIGMVIFALGMLALTQLQGGLARNSADSNARTVATNIAEELIEEARTFSQINTDPAGIKRAYQDIGNVPASIERAGNVFTVQSAVTDYYYEGGTFTDTPPVGAARSDMKLLEVTVSWGNSDKFYVDGSESDEGVDLGSGSITLRDVISSITSPSGGKVALGTAGDNSYAPPVDYSPGENPDIVSIDLGENKFKESTTPLPDVIRADELVETRFDVVTYSQNADNATFLRREEFRAVSCECTLRIPSSSDEGGLRPTVWTGSEYSEGEFVEKPYGEEASNQQSTFCGICCRDHHDGGTGLEDDPADPGRTRYSPFANSVGYYDATNPALQGDHLHYNRNRVGELSVATNDGDRYLEACRMIRKDGFWRIAQDLRQEGLNAFPADFLDDEIEVGLYSDYVTEAVSDYESSTDPDNNLNPTNAYEDNPPSLTLPADATEPLLVPGRSFAEYAEMAPDGVSEQQLRARGIYIDYMPDELRKKINCLDRPDGDGESCDVPEVTSGLEIIPFYDVQLTWLARWNETPNNNPVDVMNEPIADGNTHKRGIAKLTTGSGFSTTNSTIHSRNLGLTGTDPIDLQYGPQTRRYDLWVRVVDESPKPALSGVTVAGNITSAIPGVKASDIDIEADGSLCDRTLTGFECANLSGAKTPSIAVFNYFKQGRTLLACSLYDGLVDLPPRDFVATTGNNKSKFSLPTLVSTTEAHIVIKENTCD